MPREPRRRDDVLMSVIQFFLEKKILSHLLLYFSELRNDT